MALKIMKKIQPVGLGFIIFLIVICLRSELQADNTRGLIHQGMNYYDEGNYVAALENWKSASKKGNRDADFLLGFLYDGVLQNDEEALYFFKKAALSGHVQAQVNVGIKYERGEGTDIDKKIAVYWYTEAAFNQNNIAQFRLASLLQDEFNKKEESHFWFSKSAQLGNPEAHLALATNYILGQGVEKNLTLAHVSCNLATILSRDISNIRKSIRLRTELENQMTKNEIKKAEVISRKCIEKKFKECITYGGK